MPAPGTTADIRAAGAVVWRTRGRVVEIAVVHRPRYDDWSLPKGKLEGEETPLDAAVREVREEIGSTLAVSRRLPPVTYRVGATYKEVRYWLARHVAGEFGPNDEVDELRWMTPSAARGLLSYRDERHLVEDLEQVPLPDAVVVLVRHAHAGKRSSWSGADVDRPLDSIGRRQAAALVRFLSRFAPERIVSAEPQRCIQTVTPLAEHLGVEITVDPAFGDAVFDTSPQATEDALTALARPGSVTVVASQGGAIPGVLERIRPRHRMPDSKKGTAWVLGFVDGGVLSAEHYADASR